MMGIMELIFNLGLTAWKSSHALIVVLLLMVMGMRIQANIVALAA